MQAEVMNHFDPHRERARHRTMCRVRVVNRKTLNLNLPDGNTVNPGTADILVYEDNVKAIEALVEHDTAAMAAAERRFELRIAEQVQEKLGSPYTQRSVEDMADFLKSKEGHAAKVPETHAMVLATTGTSVEAEFQAIMRRGVKPLASCEVIDRNIPEPQRTLMVEESTRQASILANALKEAGVFGGGNAGNANQGQNRKQ
jgi:hypothetical protein